MTALLFTITTLACLLLFYLGTGRNKEVLAAFVIWQLIVGTLAALNFFERNPIFFSLAILGTILLTLLSLRRIDRQKLSTKILLSIHVLRIPVELTLYQLYLQKKIPLLMTFRGWNFDIFIGLSALAILIYMTRKKSKRKFFMLWNITGIAFLAFIVVLAILSSPLPIQQLAFAQPNIAILEYPYCFLPICVVPIVLLSHILLISEQSRCAGMGIAGN